MADFVGGVLDVTWAALRDGGRHASVADREAASAAGAYVWVRPDAAGLARLGEWADAGRLTVPVSEVFSLADVAEAFRRSMSGHTRGKIAIRVSDPG